MTLSDPNAVTGLWGCCYGLGKLYSVLDSAVSVQSISSATYLWGIGFLCCAPGVLLRMRSHRRVGLAFRYLPIILIFVVDQLQTFTMIEHHV